MVVQLVAAAQVARAAREPRVTRARVMTSRRLVVLWEYSRRPLPAAKVAPAALGPMAVQGARAQVATRMPRTKVAQQS